MTTSTATQLVESWCRLRTDSPTRADELVTDDYRLWSASDPGSDSIIGPRDLARFATDNQQLTGARITPGVIASDDHRVAHTWNAALPGGDVLTGIDVARVDPSGKLETTWSVTGERPDTIDHLPPTGTSSPAAIEAACAQWTQLWNGEVDRAHDLVTDDFGIWFGNHRSADDSVLGPQAMADYVQAFRDQLGTVRFTEHGDFLIDAGAGRAAVLWTVTLPAEARPEGMSGSGEFDLGGIDLFQFSNDRIARVWSITGNRPHTLQN